MDGGGDDNDRARYTETETEIEIICLQETHHSFPHSKAKYTHPVSFHKSTLKDILLGQLL